VPIPSIIMWWIGAFSLFSLSACVSGEGELFLGDLKGYYLSGGLTDSLIESNDEGIHEITPEPNEWESEWDGNEFLEPEENQEGDLLVI